MIAPNEVRHVELVVGNHSSIAYCRSFECIKCRTKHFVWFYIQGKHDLFKVFCANCGEIRYV